MNNLTRDQWLSTNWNITTDSEKMELWNRINAEHLFISVQDALNYIEEVLKLKREEFKTMHAKGIDEAIVSLMYFIEKEDARYDWMIVRETNHISDIIDQVYVLWKKEFGTEQEYAIKELLKMVALYGEYVTKRSSGDFPIIFLKTYQDTIERRYYSDIKLISLLHKARWRQTQAKHGSRSRRLNRLRPQRSFHRARCRFNKNER